MKRFARAAALLLLVFLLSTVTFAAEDCYPACYTFTPPEGFALVEGETALWTNADQTANINIIVEENTGVNPYDLTEEDLTALRDSTAKVVADGLAQYQGKVDKITAETTDRKEMVRICIESSYVMEDVAIRCRQTQYVFFTKTRTVYVTGTVLTDFAADGGLMASFDAAAQALQLQGELYDGPTEPGNGLVVWVIIGAIVGGAGGLTLFLLRQRKKAEEPQTEEVK